MANDTSKLILVDAMALAYQSFFALQNLKSPAGRPTGAVYGFYQTVEQLREEHRPDYFVVVTDRGAPVERMEALAAYKADRPPTPTELLEQLPIIEELLTVLGVNVLSVENVEADDIMGTLARRHAGPDNEVLIFSPDKDMLQVVDEHIRVLRRHGQTTKVYDREAVLERYGCPPERFPDLLGLMGDSVDGIPGVPGVGEKTASALLKEYDSLDNVLDSAAKIPKPKLRENLQTYREQAILSRDLATLKTNLDIETSLEDLRPVQPDWRRAAEMFRELGFRKASALAESHLQGPVTSLFDLIPGNGQTYASEQTDYRTVSVESDLRALADLLRKQHPFGLDTETTGTDSSCANLVGICLGLSEGRGWYIPIAHIGGPNLDLGMVRQVLGPIFSDPGIGKIGHNLKYDARVLDCHDLHVEGWVGDSMILANLLHTQLDSVGLKDLCVRFLEREMAPITDLIGTKKSEQISMAQVDVRRAAEYGAKDAEVTLALHRCLESEIEQQGVESWYRNVELPLALVLLGMESKGVRVDPDILKGQAVEVGTMIARLEQECYEIAGREFNLNSTQQLAKILFDERGVSVGKDRSTRQDVLEDLAAAGEPLAAKIIEYRQASKLKSTYLDALPLLIDDRDGRVHTSYNTTIANTGRISSNTPNLQNIPIRTDLGRRVREAFIAAPGCTFVAADYSQIELRVLAHFSEDPGFLKAFQEGLDIHAFTASEIFEIPQAQVDKDMRRKAKEINFGLNYGMSSFGLAARLGISRGEAKTFMDRYFSRYPRIREYFDKVLEAAERDGYVTTLAGRRVEVPRPRSRTGAEARVAINAPIQGSAADILKKAMVDLAVEIKSAGLRSAMVLTVHDEIILEAPDSESEAVRGLLPRVMKQAFQISVPLEVDVKVGESWSALG